MLGGKVSLGKPQTADKPSEGPKFFVVLTDDISLKSQFFKTEP